MKIKKKVKTIKVKIHGETHVITIDDSLEKYKDVVLFPEKLAAANEMLRTTGLPKMK